MTMTGNLAAHKFGLQTLIPQKGKKILAICLGYFAQNFNQPFDENGQTKFLATQVTLLAKFWGYSWELTGVFGSNVPLALLIDPLAWLMFPLTGKNFPLQKLMHIWAQIGQNPLYA